MNNLFQEKQSDFPNQKYEIYFIHFCFWLTLSEFLYNKGFTAEKSEE